MPKYQPNRRAGAYQPDIYVVVVLARPIPGESHLAPVGRETRVLLEAGVGGQGDGRGRLTRRSRARLPASPGQDDVVGLPMAGRILASSRRAPM